MQVEVELESELQADNKTIVCKAECLMPTKGLTPARDLHKTVLPGHQENSKSEVFGRGDADAFRPSYSFVSHPFMEEDSGSAISKGADNAHEVAADCDLKSSPMPSPSTQLPPGAGGLGGGGGGAPPSQRNAFTARPGSARSQRHVGLGSRPTTPMTPGGWEVKTAAEGGEDVDTAQDALDEALALSPTGEEHEARGLGGGGGQRAPSATVGSVAQLPRDYYRTRLKARIERRRKASQKEAST